MGWGHIPAGAALGGTLGCRCQLAGGGASLSSTTARVRLLHSPLTLSLEDGIQTALATVFLLTVRPPASALSLSSCFPCLRRRTAQGDPSAADTESRCRRVGGRVPTGCGSWEL